VGYANVTIPKSDVPHIETLHVFVDNSPLGGSSVTITSDSTAYFVYFTFTFHSPVLIDIQLTAPENAATPNILGLDPTLFYEIVGALVAVVVVVSAAFVVRRRGRTGPTSDQKVSNLRNRATSSLRYSDWLDFPSGPILSSMV